MFQTLAIPSHSQSQSLPFTTKLSSISSSNRDPHRTLSVRCRAAPPNDFAGCLVASRSQAPASFCEVLKVKQTASPADIKTAYRRLAKIYHPDAVQSPDRDLSDGPDFIQIHNAYETLSDPKARAVYDRSIGRRMVARSAVSVSGCYASSSSCSGRRPGFYSTRRWESDQCW